jgi:hypothetical protein
MNYGQAEILSGACSAVRRLESQKQSDKEGAG